MAKINFIFFCNNVTQDSNKNLNVVGIFDTIRADKFPATHRQMFVVVNFDIGSGDHKESFEIYKDDRLVLRSEVFSFFAPNNRHQFIHRIDGLNLLSPGRYDVKIFIDNKEMGGSYFTVAINTKTNLA